MIQYWAAGTVTTLLSTELNALATSSGLTAGAISSVGGSSGVFNNAYSGGGIGGYTYGILELLLGAPAGALTAGTGAYVWFLKSIDGTNFEDGSATVIPARQADAVLTPRAASSAQRFAPPGPVLIPPATWYVLLSHNTGQTWAASGNTLRLLPVTLQGP